jgi:hypothetical protein
MLPTLSHQFPRTAAAQAIQWCRLALSPLFPLRHDSDRPRLLAAAVGLLASVRTP